MSGKRDDRLGVAKNMRDSDVAARGDEQETLSARRDGDSLKEGGAKEPCSENKPPGSGYEVLVNALSGAVIRGRGEPVEEEGGGGPSPCFLDEIDIERITFGRKVMSFAEWMRKMSEKRIGSVEIGVV